MCRKQEPLTQEREWHVQESTKDMQKTTIGHKGR